MTDNIFGMKTAADVYARLRAIRTNHLAVTLDELIKLRAEIDEAISDITTSLDDTARGFNGDRASDLAAALAQAAESVNMTGHLDDLLYVGLLSDPTVVPPEPMQELLNIISRHPDGISGSDLVGEVPAVRLVLRALLNANQITVDDGIYRLSGTQTEPT